MKFFPTLLQSCWQYIYFIILMHKPLPSCLPLTFNRANGCYPLAQFLSKNHQSQNVFRFSHFRRVRDIFLKMNYSGTENHDFAFLSTPSAASLRPGPRNLHIAALNTATNSNLSQSMCENSSLSQMMSEMQTRLWLTTEIPKRMWLIPRTQSWADSWPSTTDTAKTKSKM